MFELEHIMQRAGAAAGYRLWQLGVFGPRLITLTQIQSGHKEVAESERLTVGDQIGQNYPGLSNSQLALAWTIWGEAAVESYNKSCRAAERKQSK